MTATLTLISLVSGLTYMGLMIAGILNARHRTDLLKQERAFRFYLLASAATCVDFLADVTRNGWAGGILASYCLACSAATLYLTGKQCDRLEGISR